MNNNLLLLLTVCSSLMASCTKHLAQPISSDKASNNPAYTVQYLFEHDGCKVYRFNDNGNLVYFTSCNGETTRVTSDSTGTKYIKSTNQKQ